MADEKFPNVTSYDSDWDAPPPLKISHIKRWIELDQVGVAEGSKLYMHWDPVSVEDPGVKTTVGGVPLGRSLSYQNLFVTITSRFCAD